MRPLSIIRFEQFFWASIVIGLINAALNFTKLTEQMAATGAPVEILFVSFAAGLLINALLWLFIARRASNVAKWILVVLMALGLFGIFTWPTLLAQYGPLYIGLTVIATVLSYTAVGFLFRGDAVRWLKSKGVAGPVDAAVFE